MMVTDEKPADLRTIVFDQDEFRGWLLYRIFLIRRGLDMNETPPKDELAQLAGILKCVKDLNGLTENDHERAGSEINRFASAFKPHAVGGTEDGARSPSPAYESARADYADELPDSAA
jgi:hypothetical protein